MPKLQQPQQLKFAHAGITARGHAPILPLVFCQLQTCAPGSHRCCSTSTSASQWHEKAKVQLAFPFPSIFLEFGFHFGTFKRSRKTRKRRRKRGIPRTLDFPSPFGDPPRRNTKKENATEANRLDLVLIASKAVWFLELHGAGCSKAWLTQRPVGLLLTLPLSPPTIAHEVPHCMNCTSAMFSAHHMSARTKSKCLFCRHCVQFCLIMLLRGFGCDILALC